MNPERHLRISELFEAARRLPAKDRAAFLEESCDGDAELRAEVESLLAHHDAGPDEDPVEVGAGLAVIGALEGHAEDAADRSGLHETVPERFGRYRLLRKIGEGAMGRVYEAEQDHPHRRVALKVIRPGAASSEAERRFRVEAEVLGWLQHPGIAQIFEAGTAETDLGLQPFFAMEFVEGEDLAEHARSGELGVRERLELVAAVCDAVEYAHQKGVIHRDLKPGNILVDASGQPKVLDFGVARAIDADLQTTTLQTSAGQLVGTLAYMSPEQAAGDPRELDTRSDVYALGVICFELCSGRLPHALAGLSVAQAVRVIQEEDTTRLSSIDLAFHGDVDTIVSTALEKDKNRRYPSAAAMAADIRRFLADEPIQARPTSTLYRLRKFARRNRALVGGIAATFVALVAGTVLATWFAIREAEQNAEATRQTYRAGMMVAANAVETGRVDRAAVQLEASPESLRGWEWRHLKSRLDGSLVTLREDSQITGVGFSASGDRVVVASRTLRVRDVDTGEALHEFPPDEGDFYTTGTYVAGGRWIAAGTARGSVRIWDAETFGEVVVLTDESAKIKRLVVADDGSHAVAVDSRSTLRWWALPEGRLLGTREGGDVALGPDHRTLAVVHESTPVWGPGTIQLLDMPTATNTGIVLGGHSLRITRVVYSPDGSRIASSSQDESVRLWDSSTGREIDRMSEHSGFVHAVAFSPDGQLVASSAEDFTVRIWDVASRAVTTLVGHTSPVYEIAFSADGGRLVSGARDGTVRVWDAGGPFDVPSGDSAPGVACFSPDDSLVAWPTVDPMTLRVWDRDTGRALATARGPEGIPQFYSIIFDGTGDRIIAAASHIVVWDARTLDELLVISGTGRRYQTVAISPDGRWLVAGDGAAELTLFDATTGEHSARRRHGGIEVFNVAFSPDGTRVASFDRFRTVRLWDSDDLRPIWQTAKEPDRQRLYPYRLYQALDFHPDGDVIASLSAENTVRLRDVASGEHVGEVGGHSGILTAVAFAPDGDRLVTGDRAGTIILWDARTLDQIVELDAGGGNVATARFSHDGESLLTAGDYSMRIWNTTSARDRAGARHGALALALEAEPIVDSLFEKLGDALRVAERLAGDTSLDAPSRRAALRVTLRRAVEHRRRGGESP